MLTKQQKRAIWLVKAGERVFVLMVVVLCFLATDSMMALSTGVVILLGIGLMWAIACYHAHELGVGNHD